MRDSRSGACVVFWRGGRGAAPQLASGRVLPDARVAAMRHASIYPSVYINLAGPTLYVHGSAPPACHATRRAARGSGTMRPCSGARLIPSPPYQRLILGPRHE
jgi:hypothetical protein